MSIEKRLSSSGKPTYTVRFRDPDGLQRKRTFAKKGDADRFETGVSADILRGQYLDPQAARVTFREYVEHRWLPTRVALRPGTLDLYASHMRNHVMPMFGARQLGSIRRSDVTSFVALLTTKLAPSTVGIVFAVLRSVLACAVDDGHIAANPCLRASLPRVEARVIAPLAPSAVLALAAAITPRYAVTVYLGAGAGLRQGEALGLLVSRVDFLRRRVNVEEQMQGNGSAPQLSPLKTRASRRVVPVDDIVLEAIAEHIAKWPAGPSGLLITNRLDEPVRRSSFGHCWQRAVEAAGLPEGTRFHDLRHFYASTLIAANLHPKSMQTRLGHATIAETMDTYGHLFPDAEDGGRGAVDAILRTKIIQDVPKMRPQRTS